MNSKPPPHWTKALAQITNMTGNIAGSIGLCTYLGYKAGERFGHPTLFVVLGLLVGLTGAAMALIRFMKNSKEL